MVNWDFKYGSYLTQNMQQISLGWLIEWETTVYFWPLFVHFKTQLTTLTNSAMEEAIFGEKKSLFTTTFCTKICNTTSKCIFQNFKISVLRIDLVRNWVPFYTNFKIIVQFFLGADFSRCGTDYFFYFSITIRLPEKNWIAWNDHSVRFCWVGFVWWL